VKVWYEGIVTESQGLLHLIGVKSILDRHISRGEMDGLHRKFLLQQV
jgi:hypothetical protein